jgi:hypothetical protein
VTTEKEEDRYDVGYNEGYDTGQDYYRDDYYRAEDRADAAEEALKELRERCDKLEEWLAAHYPTALTEFEKSTAVAERMESA